MDFVFLRGYDEFKEMPGNKPVDFGLHKRDVVIAQKSHVVVEPGVVDDGAFLRFRVFLPGIANSP